MIKKITLNRSNNKKRGFTLLETLVALAVFLLVSSAGFSIIFNSITASVEVQNRVTAFFLAQEAMEHVINIRNINLQQGEEDWLDGLDECMNGSGCNVNVYEFEKENSVLSSSYSNMCLNKETGRYDPQKCDEDGWDETDFSRVIMIEEKNDKEATVDVYVRWPDNREVKVNKHIFKWK